MLHGSVTPRSFTISQMISILRRRHLITDIRLRPLHPDRRPRPSIGSKGMDFAEKPEFGGGVLWADQRGGPLDRYISIAGFIDAGIISRLVIWTVHNPSSE